MESAQPQKKPMSESRRRLMRRALWTLGGLTGGGTGLSLFGERNYPRVYRVSVPIRNLPPALQGLTICQLSDLHRSHFVTEEFLRRGAALANSLNPDVTVVTGDFVTDASSDGQSCAAALSTLRARYGVYGVLGNHDYWSGEPEAVSDALNRNGVRILTNSSVRLTHGGTDWWLCGVDDMWAGDADLERALGSVPPGAFHALLCHEPDFADQVAVRGVPLQLSGHSHGGQCLLPNGQPLVTPQYGRKYARGLKRVAGSETWVYTNVGLGVITVPIRLNCPPEVTLLTLTRAV